MDVSVFLKLWAHPNCECQKLGTIMWLLYGSWSKLHVYAIYLLHELLRNNLRLLLFFVLDMQLKYDVNSRFKLLVQKTC